MFLHIVILPLVLDTEPSVDLCHEIGVRAGKAIANAVLKPRPRVVIVAAAHDFYELLRRKAKPR
jgi:hypothetical protein